MVRQRDQQSKAFYELSAMILNLLRSPPAPIDFLEDNQGLSDVEDASSFSIWRRNAGMQQMTPAGFASLLLGICLALMLCGSVTFFIGFLLMPWVIGLAMIFSVVGFVSSVSMIGRSILYPSSSPPSSPRKNFSSGWKTF